VTNRRPVATFYSPRHRDAGQRPALTGVAVNVALKVALMGTLAQIGLALATPVGAGQSVAGAVLRGSGLPRTRPRLDNVACPFAAAGVCSAAALWATARFASFYFAADCTPSGTRRVLLLIVAGASYTGLDPAAVRQGVAFVCVRDRHLGLNFLNKRNFLKSGRGSRVDAVRGLLTEKCRHCEPAS